MAVLKTLTINGVTYTVTPRISDVLVRANAWEGSDGAYHQVVDVPGATSNSKVNLQLAPNQVVEFGDQDIYFTTENNGGVVIVHAIGDKPLKDYIFQATVTVVTDVTMDDEDNVVVGGGGSGGNGFSPIAKVTQSENGAVITITDKSGTTTATVTNGAKGDKGDKGDTGATPKLSIGTVTTLNAGSNATASITGTTTNPILNLGIPKGADGSGGSGGAGADGVGIASVRQTTTSTADDGNNIITVTLTDGTSSTFTVQNGSKGSTGSKGDKGDTGAAGKTPVRGTDYWTSSDIAEIKSYVDDAILGGAW